MVEISDETAEVAFRELEMLIDSTLNEDEDLLQDDIFRARIELEDTLGANSNPTPDTDRDQSADE